MTIRCDELENYVIHVIWPVSVVFVHVKDNEIVHDHGGLKALKFVTSYHPYISNDNKM